MHRDLERKLTDTYDTAQAFRSAADAAPSVQSLGTTASTPESIWKSGVEIIFWYERGRTSEACARLWDGWRFHTGVGDTFVGALADCIATSRAPRSESREARLSVAPVGGHSPTGAHVDELHTRPVETFAPLITPASEWQADLEYVWRMRMAPTVDKLAARAKVQRKRAAAFPSPPDGPIAVDEHGWERVVFLRSAEWNEHRARALALKRADLVKTCRTRWRSVRCGCGTKEFPVGCDAPQLCEWCRKKHWRKWRHRITRSMDIHLRAARAAWNRHRRGMMPGVYLITLTGPHSGDIETDRKRMGEAWRSLSRAAHAGKWWSHYALTWEVTAGKSGTPHVHAHIAVITSWIPYEDLHRAWRRAMPGALVLDVQAPNRRRNESGRAANYLAKYVTKGIEPSELTGQQAGQLLVAFHGRRKVSTSARFWIRVKRDCGVCGQEHQAVGAPCSLQDIAPGAVLSSWAERSAKYRALHLRGQPQVGIRWMTSADTSSGCRSQVASSESLPPS